MKPDSPVTAGSPPPPFPEHLRTALQGFRAALLELLASVNADPAKPQDLARQFGLNKNLTWKVSKIATGSDLLGSVPHIPGAAGLEIFLRAMGDAGAPKPLVEATRGAAREFDHVVEVHTGDRPTLEMMIDGLTPGATQQEQSRKLAYQGNSGTWGVRAKTQLVLNMLAPSEREPGMVDLVQIGGLLGFRRLRQDARWLLFRRERWTDEGPNADRDVIESLDPDFPAERGVPLMGDFCSRPTPEIEVIEDGGEEQYELPPGPVGNTAALDCIYGHVTRSVGPAYGETAGEHSEIGCNMITPAEDLLLDLLVHRAFPWAMDPELVVYSRLDGGTIHAAARRARNVLPVNETVTHLGRGATGLATPLVPGYANLVRSAFERMGWEENDFHAFRVVMPYPPIPTAALLRSELPVKKG